MRKRSPTGIITASLLGLFIGFGAGIIFKNDNPRLVDNNHLQNQKKIFNQYIKSTETNEINSFVKSIKIINPPNPHPKLEEIIHEKYQPDKYKDSYDQFLFYPHALDLADNLGTNFRNWKIDDYYIPFLEAPNSAILMKDLDDHFDPNFLDSYTNLLNKEGSLEIIKRMGYNPFNKYMIPEYIRLLEAPNIKKFLNLTGFTFVPFYKDEVDLTIEFLNHPKSAKLLEYFEGIFNALNLEEYYLLLENDFNPEFIASLNVLSLLELANAVKYDELPKSFMPYFSSNIIEYSIRAAGKNPVFGSDKHKLRRQIRFNLITKKHHMREDADYFEYSFQIDNIENINILYLIKGYVDFFNNPKNVKDIYKEIEGDLDNPYSEEGGFVADTVEGYKFNRYNVSDFWKLRNLEDDGSYSPPSWFSHIGRIGLFHLHATNDDNSIYSGPSGSKDSEPGSDGDIPVLISFLDTNPYRIDCVITKLKGNYFNADIYFSDVVYGQTSREIIVLDLGIFHKSGEPKK